MLPSNNVESLLTYRWVKAIELNISIYESFEAHNLDNVLLPLLQGVRSIARGCLGWKFLVAQRDGVRIAKEGMVVS